MFTLKLFVAVSTLALVGQAGATNVQPELTRVGLRFDASKFPREMSDCEANPSDISGKQFAKGNKVLFVEQYRCGGKDQLWLMRRIDKSGKKLAASEAAYDPNGPSQDRIYVVDDIFFLSEIQKPSRPFGECAGFAYKAGEPVQFAFAVGVPVSMYQNSPRIKIGEYSKKISEAWKVNVVLRKFEPMSPKGMICEEGH